MPILDDNQSIATVSTHLTDLSLDDDVPELQSEAELVSFLARGRETLSTLKDKLVRVAQIAVRGCGNYSSTKIGREPAAQTVRYHNQKD